MGVRSWKSITIGLGLPALGLLVVLPLIANTSVHVLGFPLVFAWLFALCPLTSVCLWVAWQIDEPHYRDEAPVTTAAAEEAR